MDIVECFNSLHLNDNFVFHQDVDPVSAIKLDVLIDNWKSFLNFDVKPRITQFMTEARFIS